jgi:hypothetical protein
MVEVGEGRLRRETVEGFPLFVGGEARAEGERRPYAGLNFTSVHSGRNVVEDGDDGHVDPDVFRLAPDDVRWATHALVELDDRVG